MLDVQRLILLLKQGKVVANKEIPNINKLAINDAICIILPPHFILVLII